MENKTIFKVGDRVFDFIFGWGNIAGICDSLNYPIMVNFDNLKHETKQFTLDGKYVYTNKTPRLSFTEYNLVTGGFSQERPLPEIKYSQLVYVKREITHEWAMRFFSHWDNGKPSCYLNQQKSGITSYWPIWSITNPLIEE